MPPIDPPRDPEGWVLSFGATIVLVLLGLIAVLFCLWTLWRVIRDPSLPDVPKIVWVLVVILLPVVGALAYWMFRPRATIAGPMQRM